MKTPPVRKDIEDLKPYVVPLNRYEVELDSNESPWNLPDVLLQEIAEAIGSIEFNRYPDAGAAWLKQSIADSFTVLPENILVGNGSNEIILNILLAFGGAGRTAMLFEPTYSMHDVLARIAATDIISVPLDNEFDIDIEVARAAILAEKPDIVFITSPNNPTGNVTPVALIEKVCRMGDFLVVVDEAYGEFSSESCLPLIKKYKNLAVVKTFSKAFRMAAARVGYVIADEGIVDGMNRVKLPYNLNALSQIAAALVWQKKDEVLRAVADIVFERERMFAEMSEIKGVKPFKSGANFILFKTEKGAAGVFERILTKNVQIRDFSSKNGLADCLRVTVGTAAENDAFLAALRESA
jgi:histidinol-phosphate aminotransferase